MLRYPTLYNIVRKKSATVASFFERVPLNVSFRRSLVGDNLVLWHSLVTRIVHVELNEENDVFKWNLTKSGQFTVKSMYSAIMNTVKVFYHKSLWNLKVPLKIKIFMWYLIKGVVLTKDNLFKRNWHGSKRCVYCDSDETIQHLFFNCHYAQFMWRLVYWVLGLSKPRSVRHAFGNWLLGVSSKTKNLLITGVSAVCWAIWISRNDLVFHNKTMLTYLQVLFRATHWLRTWAQLHREEDGSRIKQVCQRLETAAIQIFAHHGWRFTNSIAL